MMPYVFGDPPEPTEEQKAEAIRQHMRMVDFHNRMSEWFAGMTAHQLWMLRILFGNISRSGDYAATNAALHEGMMIGHLQRKGNCEECGEDHLKANLEAQAPFPTVKNQGPPVGVDAPGQLPEDVHADKADLYRQYNVAPVTDNPQDPRVRCNRGKNSCGMVWPTFADREANGGPDECPQCRQREKWG
jgi:hypothetical protein